MFFLGSIHLNIENFDDSTELGWTLNKLSFRRNLEIVQENIFLENLELFCFWFWNTATNPVGVSSFTVPSGTHKANLHT